MEAGIRRHFSRSCGARSLGEKDFSDRLAGNRSEIPKLNFMGWGVAPLTLGALAWTQGRVLRTAGHKPSNDSHLLYKTTNTPWDQSTVTFYTQNRRFRDPTFNQVWDSCSNYGPRGVGVDRKVLIICCFPKPSTCRKMNLLYIHIFRTSNPFSRGQDHTDIAQCKYAFLKGHLGRFYILPTVLPRIDFL